MKPGSKWYLLFLLVLFGATKAYWLDPKCRDTIGEPLREGLKAAFTRILAAKNALKERSSPPEYRTLAGYIFKPEVYKELEDILNFVHKLKVELDARSYDRVPSSELAITCSTSETYEWRNITDLNGVIELVHINTEFAYRIGEDVVDSCLENGLDFYVIKPDIVNGPVIIQLCKRILEQLKVSPEETINEFRNDHKPKYDLTKVSKQDLEKLPLRFRSAADLIEDLVFVLTRALLLFETSDSLGEGHAPEGWGSWKDCVEATDTFYSYCLAFFASMVNYITYSHQMPDKDGNFHWIDPIQGVINEPSPR